MVECAGKLIQFSENAYMTFLALILKGSFWQHTEDEKWEMGL